MTFAMFKMAMEVHSDTIMPTKTDSFVVTLSNQIVMLSQQIQSCNDNQNIWLAVMTGDKNPSVCVGAIVTCTHTHTPKEIGKLPLPFLILLFLGYSTQFAFRIKMKS